MKTFKNWINSIDIKKLPIALVTHGKHNKLPKIDIKKLPIALVTHGKHNKKKVNENVDISKDYDDHEETNELHHELHEHHQIKPEHMKHLVNYTESSRELNDHLFYHAQIGKDVDEDEDVGGHYIKGLDEATHSYKAPHDMHVYSGVEFNPEKVKNSDGMIRLPAYTSTSLHRYIANGFADELIDGDTGHSSKHVLHIHVNEGQHGVYLGKHSLFDSEREFLLPRDTVIKLHPHVTFDGDYHVHHAEIVQQGNVSKEENHYKPLQHTSMEEFKQSIKNPKYIIHVINNHLDDLTDHHIKHMTIQNPKIITRSREIIPKLNWRHKFHLIKSNLMDVMRNKDLVDSLDSSHAHEIVKMTGFHHVPQLSDKLSDKSVDYLIHKHGENTPYYYNEIKSKLKTKHMDKLIDIDPLYIKQTKELHPLLTYEQNIKLHKKTGW